MAPRAVAGTPAGVERATPSRQTQCPYFQ